jgi:ATP-dependent RNA helicase DeaD
MTLFTESGLNSELLAAVQEMGFTTPTPIQAECIPYLLAEARDLIANAQTGTGKTAAFGLPILHQLDLQSKQTQALILSPTRELALQISREMERFGKNMKGLRITTVYGGASAENQISSLKRGAHVVVATPGRALDLIKRKKLNVNAIQWLVLDEADEMLNMGFRDELDGILETTPADRQSLLFSATLPEEIKQMSKKYMQDPHRIAVAKANTGVETINHLAYKVNAKDKYEALKRIADLNPAIYAIVFCRTRQETKDISDKLIKDGYNADALHGDLSQSQREFIMRRFRLSSLQILVATDVAARGLDVDNLSHVINYSLPDDSEVYVHRTGRTGRAGKKGTAISLVHSRELHKLKTIQKMLKREIEFKKVPMGREICEKQLFHLVSTMEKAEVNNSEMESFMDVIYKKLEWLSKEELIKRFVAVEFNRFLEYYKNAKDLNIPDDREKRNQRKQQRDGDQGQSFSRRASDKNFVRLYMNIGSKSHMNPPALIGLVNKGTPDLSVPVGKIEILKKFSFFEIDKKYLNQVLDGVNGLPYRGETVAVEAAESEGASYSSSPSPRPRPQKTSPRGRKKPTSKERRRTKRK